MRRLTALKQSWRSMKIQVKNDRYFRRNLHRPETYQNIVKPWRSVLRTPLLFKLMSVLTQDNSFTVAQNEVKGEMSNMGEFFDKVERRRIAKGLIQGKILAFNEVGLSPADIAQRVDMSEDKVKKILQEQEA